MKTHQAPIYLDSSQGIYYVYSPENGINKTISCNSNSNVYPDWAFHEHETPDKIDHTEAPYFKVVTSEEKREELLQSAIKIYPFLSQVE